MTENDGNLSKEFNTAFGSSDIYRRLVESVRAGIYVAGGKGNLVYVNQAFVHILGYASKAELIGLNFPEQVYARAEDYQKFREKMKKTGFVRDYEVHNKRKDGSMAILSITNHFIYGEKNE